MTQVELDQLLIEYAQQDLGYAKEDGTIAICETLKGLVTINYLGNDIYQAYNNMGEQLTGAMNEARMIVWVTKIYDTIEMDVVG